MPCKDRDKRRAYNRHWQQTNREKRNEYANRRYYVVRRPIEKEKDQRGRRNAKYLRPADVSAEMASCLDFNSQSVVEYGLRINRICIDCGKKQVVKVSDIKRHHYGPRCRPCSSKTRNGILSSNWKGGKHLSRGGYVRVYSPTHPYARGGYVFEHRLVMERMIGRYLKPYETVHHRNGNKQDNRPENLELRTGHHGSGVRISDLNHCRTCRCARKMKAIPLLTLDFFIPPFISTGTYLTNDRKEPDPIIY